MRLKFIDAEAEREAAFLAALADEGVDAEARLAALAGESGRRSAIAPADIVEAVLHFHGAPAALSHALLARKTRRADPAKLLAAGLKAALNFAKLPEPQHCRLMLIGPPAAGKTTMMAKLAARGRPPLATVLSTDGDRPGGMEQLADPMSVLGIEPARLDLTDETASLDAQGALLVDTGGTDAGQGFAALGELAERLRVEPVLVLPATIDADEARHFAEAARAIGAAKLLVSRLDMTRRLAGPLAAAWAGLAIIGGSVTPNFAYGLKPLGPDALARQLITLAHRSAAAG
jgi:flagellar biosynthesis protein FlhF